MKIDSNLLSPIKNKLSSCPVSIFHKCFPFVSLLLVLGLTTADIDSGGGISSDGIIQSHSSIGASFSTVLTQAGATRNRPGLIEVSYPVTSASVTDIDANGLPDSWEIQYFGGTGVNPVADADLDGTSNLLEYLAGTNPDSTSSVFRPQGTYTGGLFQMPVPTVLGRNYQIWVSRDLQNWTLQSTLAGNDTAQLFEFDDTNITSGPLHSSHHSNYFFRVQILIPSIP
jgi:hypothetical protein